MTEPKRTPAAYRWYSAPAGTTTSPAAEQTGRRPAFRATKKLAHMADRHPPLGRSNPELEYRQQGCEEMLDHRHAGGPAPGRHESCLCRCC